MYHGAAKHFISSAGREQLLEYILELETAEHLSHQQIDTQGTLSWCHDFKLRPLSRSHRNYGGSWEAYAYQQQQELQLNACRSFGKGEVLGFVLGKMMSTYDAEQQLLAAALAAPSAALQAAKHRFDFLVEEIQEREDYLAAEILEFRFQMQQRKVVCTQSRSITVIGEDCTESNPLAKVRTSSGRQLASRSGSCWAVLSIMVFTMCSFTVCW